MKFKRKKVALTVKIRNAEMLVGVSQRVIIQGQIMIRYIFEVDENAVSVVFVRIRSLSKRSEMLNFNKSKTEPAVAFLSTRKKPSPKYSS